MICKIIAKVTGIFAVVALGGSVILLILYLAGVRPYVVWSGSMEPAVPTGSLCFVNSRTSYQDIEANDIAAYRSSLGEYILHRVIAVTGEGFKTKGDANERTDGVTITKENYIGRALFWIPKAGYLFGILQTSRGRILGVMVIACLVICSLFLCEDSPKEKEQERGQGKLEDRG